MNFNIRIFFLVALTILGNTQCAHALNKKAKKNKYQEIHKIENDCNYANLNLEREDFRGRNLRNCNFRGANLSQADFTGADLSGADFRDARISAVSFNSANLRKANFRSCWFQYIIDSNGKYQGVDLRNAELAKTNFKKAVLIAAKVNGTSAMRSAPITKEYLKRVGAIYNKDTVVGLDPSRVSRF